MKISIERTEKKIEVHKIKIFIEDDEFIISLNKFGGLVINKQCYGDGKSNIIIEPCVSNEIIIS